MTADARAVDAIDAERTDQSPPDPPTSRRSKAVTILRPLAGPLVLVGMIAYFGALYGDRYLSKVNLVNNVLGAVAFLAIVAAGQTVVMVVGEHRDNAGPAQAEKPQRPVDRRRSSGDGVSQHRIANRHVEERTMGFYVLQADAQPRGDPRESSYLVGHEVFDVRCRKLQLAAPEALRVRKSRVSSHGDALVARELHRRPHYGGVPGVKPARDVGRGDVRNDPQVRVRGAFCRPLAHICVQIDSNGLRGYPQCNSCPITESKVTQP